MSNYSYQDLYQFSHSVFIKMGCPEADATQACETLLSADLRGIDSHGVARLTGYVRLWEKGRINATPNIKVTYETPSTAVVDGDSGLGLVVAPFAMRVAIEKAKNGLGFSKKLKPLWHCWLPLIIGCSKRHDWYFNDQCQSFGFSDFF